MFVVNFLVFLIASEEYLLFIYCEFSDVGDSGVGSIFGKGGRKIQCEAPKQFFTAPPENFAGGSFPYIWA